MNIDRTIAKLELKEMLNELLQTDNVKRWTDIHMSQFLEHAGALLPHGPNCICFWKKYLSLDTLNLLAAQCQIVAVRIELKRGYAQIVFKHELSEDVNVEDNENFIQRTSVHGFFSMLKSAILEKRYFIPESPPPQIDLMEMENRGRDVSFILFENKTAFAKLILDLLRPEDR